MIEPPQPAPGAAPICEARPSRGEIVSQLLVIPFLALIGTVMVVGSLARFAPDLLPEDPARARMWLGSGFVVALTALGVVSFRSTSGRIHRLYADRLTIGRGGNTVISLSEVQRVRVGAPMPGLVRLVRRLSGALGVLSSANAQGARLIDAQYAALVVLDLGPSSRRVIHAMTLRGGPQLIAALLDALADRIEDPPSYSARELAALGRFRPGHFTL